MKKARSSSSSPEAAPGDVRARLARTLPLALLDADPAGGTDRLAAFRWLASAAPVTWTLNEQIASRIGDRILSGTLAPGAWLREQDLAAEFGVSRGPIRDAFQLLQREGLVQVHPRRGAQVTVLSAREVRDIFAIRATLFRMVARLLAEQRDPAYVAALEEGVAVLARLAVPGADSDEYARTVFRLSLYSASACGNERLCNILTSLSLQTYRYSRIGLQSAARRKRSLALWKSTLAAIRAGDADRAERVAIQRITENGAAAEAALLVNPGVASHAR